MNTLPSAQIVPIGKAAEILGVSIDTLRRWDRAGKITSVRPDGKDRYFVASDLERIKANQPLSISEASKKLGVSSSTLRRYEQRGIIRPKRNGNGEREYDRELIQNFSPLAPKSVPKFTSPKHWQYPPAFLVVILLVTTIFSTLYIQDKYQANQAKIAASAAKVLGAKDRGGIIGFFAGIGQKVAETNKKAIEQYKTTFKIIQQTVVERTIVERIKETEKLVLDQKAFENVNAKLLQGKKPGEEEGDLPVFASGGRITALRVSTVNLLAGSVTGGTAGIIVDGSVTAADLATDAVTTSEILNDTVKAEDIAAGAVTASEIDDGTITAADLGGNIIDAGKLAGTLTFGDGEFIDLGAIVHDDAGNQGLRLPNAASASPTSPTSGEGYIAWDASNNQIIVYNGSGWTTVSGGGGSGDITGVTAGNGLSGGGTSNDVSLAVLLTTTGTTGSSSSSSGLEVSSSGLSLLKGCIDGQLLEWTDAGGWACADDNTGGGGSTVVEEGDATVDATVTNFDFLAADFTVGETPEDEVNISIDYTNSKIVRSDQNESITGSWTFSSNLAGTVNMVNLTGTPHASANTAYGLYIDQADSANTNGLDAAIVIDNSDTSGAAMGVAIKTIDAGGGFTNLFDIGGTLISTSEFTLLDGGIALSELTDSGNFAASGDVTFSDAGADTITIGDANDNVAITDAQWSISATGVAAGLSGTNTSFIAGDLSCTNCIGATEVDESGIASTGLSDTADVGYLNQSETVLNDWTFSLAETEDLAINIAISGSNSGQGEIITLTNSSSSGNQYGLVLDNAASSGVTEALLRIDNSDTDTVVTDAIEIVIGGGTGFTNLFDVNGTLISVTEFTILDSGIALSELTDSGTFTATTVDINGGAVDATTVGATTPSSGAFTTLVASGDVTFNDAGADTILIGQSGTTDDTVTIAGNVSITDDNWAISEAGVGTNLTANELSCTNCIGATEIDESGIASTGLSDTASIAYLNQSETVLNDWTFTLAAAEDLAVTHDLAGTANMVTLTGTPNASANTAYGLYIDQADSANTNGMDAAIVIDNSDTSGAPVVAAIKTIDAGGGFTNLFDIAGTLISSSEFTVLDGEITIGTETAGNFVDNVTGGAGITVTGSAGEGWEPDAAIDLLDAQDGSGSTFSYSGFEFQGVGSDELTLLQGCSDGQILKWDDESGGNGRWDCAADDTSAGAGIATVEEQDVSKTGVASRLDFNGTDFSVTAEDTNAEARIDIDYTNSKITRSNVSETILNDWTFTLAEAEDLAIGWSVSGTQAGQAEAISVTNSSSSGNQYGLTITNADSTGVSEAGILIDNADTTAGSLADGILITSSGVSAGITDGIDVSAANIENAINIGANAIAGTNFSVTGAGVLTVASCTGCAATDYIYKAKSADQAVNNSTTLTDETALQFTIGANEEWNVIWNLQVTNGSNAGPDWKSAGVKAGSTCTATLGGIEPAGAAFPQVTTTDCIEAPGALVNSAILTDAGVPYQVYMYANILGDATPDAVKMQFAHNTQTAVDLTIKAGSTMVAYKVTGADLAETYYTQDPQLMAGDVVSFDSSIEAGVKKTTKAYDPGAIGIVSSKPGLVLGDSVNTTDRPVFVALSGRVPVKVSTENGPIVPGDLLTPSSTPGVAMKALKSGIIIGQATTALNGEGMGVVSAFVKNGQGNGAKLSELLQGTKAVEDADLGSVLLEHFINQKDSIQMDSLSEILTDRLAASLEIITPKLIADEIFANKIHADQIEGLSFLASEIFAERFTQIQDALTPETATDSASLDGIDTANLTMDTITANKGLTVYGPANFMDGVTFNGAVTYLGNVVFERIPTFNTDTAGFAIIKEGAREVYVTFENEYVEVPVVSASPIWDADTPTVDTFKHLGAYILPKQEFIVASITTKGFTIILGDPAVTDLKFSWFALAVKGARTVNGDAPLPSVTPIATPTITISPSPSLTPTPSSLPIEQTASPSASPKQ